jgi:Transposase IS4
MEEEDDIIPAIEVIVEDEVGMFNEFGAPDPNGVPIEMVLAESIADIPDVIPAVEAEKWTDVPILFHKDTRTGRRSDKTTSIILKFLGRYAGYQNIPPNLLKAYDAMDILLLLLDASLVSQFVLETNHCAEQWGTKNWKLLTEIEFITFVVIIIFMGIVKLPERSMYWQRNDYGQRSTCQRGNLRELCHTGIGYLCPKMRGKH